MKHLLAAVILMFALPSFSQKLEVFNAQQVKVVEFKVGDKVFLKSFNDKAFRLGKLTKITPDSIFLNQDGYMIAEISHLSFLKGLSGFGYSVCTFFELVGAVTQTVFPIVIATADGNQIFSNDGIDIVGAAGLSFIVGTGVKVISRNWKNNIAKKRAYTISTQNKLQVNI